MLLAFVVPAVAQTQEGGTAAPPSVSQGQGGTPLSRGIEAFRQNEYDRAVRELTRAIEVDPESPDAHHWLGYTYFKQKNIEQALSELERANMLRPNASDIITNLGTVLLAKPNRTSDDTQRAVALFEQAARVAPSASASFNLGSAYTRIANDAKAADAFADATNRDPNDGKAWSNLGYTLSRLNRNDEAKAALTKAVTLNPGDPAPPVALGALLRRTGDAAGSLSILQTAQTAFPGDTSVLSELAQTYAEQRNFVQAAQTFGIVAEAHETAGTPDKTARYNQGVSLAKAGQYADAVTAYDKALTLDPAYFDALVNSGVALFSLNKMPEAATRFQQATAVRPDSTVAWANLATVNDRANNRSEAAQAWRKAVALDARNYEWRALLVSDLMTLNRYESAVPIAKQMAALRAKSAEPLNLLGLAYQGAAEEATLASKKQAFLVQALQAFEQAAKRNPQSGEAYNNQGVIHERRGEIPEAIACYRKAIAVQPRLTDARRNLARFSEAASASKGRP